MAESRWRIAVTGIGLVTPLGLTASDNVARALRGDSAVAVPAEVEGAANLGIACAVVPPFDLSRVLRHPKNLKLLGRPVRMALLAVREAIEQSGRAESVQPDERTGVYVGSGQTGLEYDEFFKALTVAWEAGREQDFKFLGGMPTRLIDRYFSLRTLANAGVGAISTEFSARGPSNNYVQGEIAPAVALSNACFDLTEQRCDAAIVCGYESLLIPSNALAFRNMELLSGGGFDPVYTPFNSGRPGLVLGEGRGCLILERLDSALERNAPVLAVIESVGFASRTSDSHGLSADPEDIRAAIADSYTDADAASDSAPDFVIARGLGTDADDLAEAAALEAVLAPETPVTALKGSTGFLGAASAIVELGIGLLCARQAELPPIHGLDNPDPRIHLNFVRGGPAHLAAPEPYGLFLSSTFGGQVAAIVARVLPVSISSPEPALEESLHV